MPIQQNISKFIKEQGFTLGLVGAVVAAIIFPDLGVKGGPLKTEITIKVAVALAFFIQGLSLPTRQIIASASKVKLHVLCQLMIFALAPAVMFAHLFAFGWIIPAELKGGFLFLAILPTTISSAIIMTSNSEGDTPTALFSTTISNILGIAISPILCAFLGIAGSDGQLSLGSLIAKLSFFMLLPLVVGQLVRPFFREQIKNAKKALKRLSNSCIVFIVYAAFCTSVANGIWQQFGLGTVATTLGATALFLGLYSFIIWNVTRLVTKDHGERIALFFCGSQKTLAAGIPMASILFAGSDAVSAMTYGLMILPLMTYHPLQLILAGLLSPIFAKMGKG